MQYSHAYDPATGEIINSCRGPAPAAWEASGLTVVAGTSNESSNTHNYLGGALTPKIAVSLIADQSEILADGQDQAVVSVSVAGGEPPASIELMVGGQSEVVSLTEGAGAASPISAVTPCAVLVRVADAITFRAGPVIIRAVQDD